MICHLSSKLGDSPYGMRLVLIFVHKAIKISCRFWRNPLVFIWNLSPFHKIRPPLLIGKSNLMDAISFVFGERTQSLRVRTVKVSVFYCYASMCVVNFVQHAPEITTKLSILKSFKSLSTKQRGLRYVFAQVPHDKVRPWPWLKRVYYYRV